MHEFPEGFQAIGYSGPFTSLFGPLYVKEIDEALVIGMFVVKKHLNPGGVAHGGMLATLADYAWRLCCFPDTRTSDPSRWLP